MTAKDQALLFACQKWHLRETDHYRDEAGMFAELARKNPRSVAMLNRERRAALRRCALHARFADALTAVVSKPLPPRNLMPEDDL